MKLGIFTSSFQNYISDTTQTLYLLTVIIYCAVKLYLLKLPKSLTPHSSKDVCTTCELINLILSELFSGFISDIMQKYKSLLIRHCSIKLKDRKYFSEGEHVIVFDNFRGTSYEAVVSEILGNNTYLVLCENGTKHVSGDNMSRDKSRAAA